MGGTKTGLPSDRGFNPCFDGSVARGTANPLATRLLCGFQSLFLMEV